MKRVILTLVIISLALTINLEAVKTNNSIAFSESYLLRAYGAEAVYWNPSLLNSEYNDLLLPGVNQIFQVANNSFDIHDYNYISGRYLTLKDKNMLLNNVDRRLVIDGQAHIVLFGMAFGNMAIVTSSHVISELRLSKKYLKLALFGNENDHYSFRKINNQLNALSYQDITIGMGDYDISQYFKNDNIPIIKMGVSASTLIGIGVVETEQYKGTFSSGLDGLAFNQDIKIKTGLGGIGTKALIGFSSQPINNLDVGMSFDNLFGFIKWLGTTKRLSYSVNADSTYASDLENDIYTQVDTTETIGKFATTLPVEMRLGAKYQYKNANISADWTQGLGNSVLTSEIGRLCLGAEYRPIPQLPIRMGYRFGNSEYPWGVSYGLGYQGKHIDYGFGLQTFKSLIPGNHSKGISFSSNISLHN